ncbi:CCC motif membrane protein [Tenacibaculum todarodis]
MDKPTVSNSNDYNYMEKQKLPNATGVIILGILSIVTCCCYGIIGLILGIVGLVLAKKAKQVYLASPEEYTGFSNVKTGKILCIVGIVLNVLFIAYIVGIVAYIGWDALSDPELLQQRIQELQ